MTAPISTPGIRIGITLKGRASLAGIFAHPKAHLAYVLVPWLQM